MRIEYSEAVSEQTVSEKTQSLSERRG